LRIRPLYVILGVIVLVLAAGGLWLRDKAIKFEAKITAMQINEVDLSAVADGAYEGSADAEIVRAQVRVTVRDHQITKIELLRHDTGQGRPAEVIPDRVVAAQSLKVDMVSGATYSSKVILKAIENALTGK